jgi:large subunit ribosomal protein L22
MGKDATPSRLRENQATATAKFLRVPPRKARLVIDAVRGKYVVDALAILKFVPNFAADAISRVIKSAIANAENSRPFDEDGKQLAPLISDNLKLVRAFVDEGPRIKRVQPRAQGRAYRIVKRMCHITVIVEEVEPKPRPVRPQRTRRPQAAARPAAKAAPAEKVKPAEVTAPAEETTAPVEATAAAENAAPVGETTQAEEAAAMTETVATDASAAPESEGSTEAETAEVPADDAKDEIGAPITTEADVAEELDKNETSAADEAPKAE